MHCPNCGKESTTEKFCRTCGMDLEAVGKLVAVHSSPEELKIRQSLSEKELARRMVSWMMWGMLVLGVGVVLLVAQKTFALGGLVRLVASLILLSGAGMALYGVLAAVRDGVKGPDKAAEPKNLASEKTTASLPEERTPVPLPSVTEHTTKLLANDEVQNRPNDRIPMKDELGS